MNLGWMEKITKRNKNKIMKKILGILVLGLLVCNFAEASWVVWNFEKGYVYIVLKNTENIENEIKNNSTNAERINQLGCTEGIKITKLKRKPPGYEMVQKNLLEQYQTRCYKITCKTKEALG